MKLYLCRNLGTWPFSYGNIHWIESVPPHGLDKGVPIAPARHFYLFGLEIAGHGARARQAEVGTLLVGKGDDFERHRKRICLLGEEPRAFNAGEDTERPIVNVSIGYAIDVRAGNNGRTFLRSKPCNLITRCVMPNTHAGFPAAYRQPINRATVAF
jgi:hypothetical protein